MIEVLDWHTHVTPRIGPEAQEHITEEIGDYEIFIGIMWKRFGTPTSKAGSGTEEEFDIAINRYKQGDKIWILFYFNQAPYTVHNKDEIEQLGKVLVFKEKLKVSRDLYWEYPSSVQFERDVRSHLTGIIRKWFPVKTREIESPAADYAAYLNYLKKENMYLDIRGLVTGEGKVHQFRIDQLDIPLRTIMRDAADKSGDQPFMTRDLPLQEALQHPHLIIRGDPGAGQSTFLRLLVFCPFEYLKRCILCEHQLISDCTISVLSLGTNDIRIVKAGLSC